MKYIPFILAIILCASPLLAQQPSISYLMCDEAKSQLQIRGSFGVDSGSVTIEDTTLGIISWSDSLIICSLPDSGKGVGGHVVVKTVKGVSNARALSIFMMEVNSPFWVFQGGAGHHWFSPYTKRWIVNWRMDISSRADNLPKIIPFECAKSSEGFMDNTMFPRYDTSTFFQYGFTFGGKIDLIHFRVTFFKEIFKYGNYDTVYTPLAITFDTTEFISGYVDTLTGNPNGLGTARSDSVFDQKILFPPNPKSTVSQPLQPNADQIKIITNENSITVYSASPIGSATAFLYSIDGRLLKRTTLYISTPGIYTLDVSDVHSHFALLVLQMEKGVITRKILF